MHIEPEVAERISCSLPERANGGESELHWLPVHRNWRPDRNRTYLAFQAGATRPAMVVKIASRPAYGDDLRTEFENLTRLSSAPDPAFKQSVPAPLEFIELEQKWILVEGAVEGRPLTSLLHRLRTDSPLFRDVLCSLTHWLLRFHSTVGITETASDVFRTVWMGNITRLRSRFEFSPDAARWLDHVESVLADPCLRAVPVVWIHGDLCPTNVLLDRNDVRVIDWEMEWVREFPQSDLLHFIHCFGLEFPDRGLGYLDFLGDILFGSGPAGRALRDCLDLYQREIPLPARLLEILPTLFWVQGAILKAEHDDLTGYDDPGYCAYVIVKNRQCQNIERFAWRSWTQ